MLSRIRSKGVVAVAVIALILGAGSTGANAVRETVGETSNVASAGVLAGVGKPFSARSGYFEQATDSVHISSTPPRAASVHGWWQDPMGNFKKKKAKVVVQLQMKAGWFWYKKAEGMKTVYSGGGSANRAAARVGCKATEKRDWRSSVDVDIIGVADTMNRLTSPTQSRKCAL